MLTWMLLPYRRYAEFSGRSRRREYWSFMLFIWLVYVALNVLFGRHEMVSGPGGMFVSSGLFGGVGIVGGLFSLFSLIPHLAVTVRRLHDQDRSGWLLLLGLIPFLGWFALLVLMCLEGTHGANSYGPDPKQIHDADVFS
ncbi:DUF805 domain-containing protein [Novosphingobium sp. Fuku2-ISO-50]|jgi:uncharacterized membrane protein YhaH (DUF805 family)|uniref:DUF805 domain-containing protein n=1 Tax=Novosphingobium sp. Fuku2-ISO-50 TaxID=1739114 RepID=UPI000A9EAC71|nr:DUF805 domain-containing protein [Novosphingobium sp. Fuku2-ISO-50]